MTKAEITLRLVALGAMELWNKLILTSASVWNYQTQNLQTKFIFALIFNKNLNCIMKQRFDEKKRAKVKPEMRNT